MALCGTGLKLSLESVGVGYYSKNSSTRLLRSSGTSLTQRKHSSLQQKCWRVRCSLSRKSTLPMESEENVQSVSSVLVEEELEHVIKFKISDFKISDRVSVGLGGRVCKTLKCVDMVSSRDYFNFFNDLICLNIIVGRWGSFWSHSERFTKVSSNYCLI